MGLCASQPSGVSGTSLTSDMLRGVGQRPNGKAPSVFATDPKSPADIDNGQQTNSLTITPVQDFADGDDSSLEGRSSVPQVGSLGATRFFKRNAEPQQPPQQRWQGQSSPDRPTAKVNCRNNGTSPASNSIPAGAQAIFSSAPAAATAAAVAAAAAAAAASATAATAAAPNGASPHATVANGASLATTSTSAGGLQPRRSQLPPTETAAQTDASLLYPLFRDPGPTVPVRWRKGEGIGAGSFGQVYLALNCDTGELLAVKEVPAGLADMGATGVVGGPGGAGGPGGGPGGAGRGGAAEAVAQLEREVALLSQLRHPNIVRYVGTQRNSGGGPAAVAGSGGGAPLYIFLEYVPGGSLSSQLSRFGPLPEQLVALYTRQLLLGLAYLHAQRTVHRDVKGANLLLEKTGVLKLADFGMAKQLMEQVSFTRSFKGSAYWMAPEVIKQQGYGVQADIWSVGCTVLEMATGKPPWSQCTSQVQAIFKIASSPDLPAIPEHLSPQASEFILLCLQRDPAARPTAEELLRHPFVTAPLARNPLPPALGDPLAGLYDSAPSRGANAGNGNIGLRGASSMTLLGPGASSAGGATTMGTVNGGTGSNFVLAMGMSPQRLMANGTAGGAAVPPTGATAGAWGTSPFGGLIMSTAAAAAAAVAAGNAAAVAAGATGGGGAVGARGSAFALALQGHAGAVGGGGAGAELLAGGGGGVTGGLSEDHLAALVLGNSVHISKAARVAAAAPADEDRDGDEDDEDGDTHIDYTTQPQQFRVRGLLTLPPLKQLNHKQLPPLGVTTMALGPDVFGVSVGTGGGGGGAGQG